MGFTVNVVCFLDSNSGIISLNEVRNENLKNRLIKEYVSGKQIVIFSNKPSRREDVLAEAGGVFQIGKGMTRNATEVIENLTNNDIHEVTLFDISVANHFATYYRNCIRFFVVKIGNGTVNSQHIIPEGYVEVSSSNKGDYIVSVYENRKKYGFNLWYKEVVDKIVVGGSTILHNTTYDFSPADDGYPILTLAGKPQFSHWKVVEKFISEVGEKTGTISTNTTNGKHIPMVQATIERLQKTEIGGRFDVDFSLGLYESTMTFQVDRDRYDLNRVSVAVVRKPGSGEFDLYQNLPMFTTLYYILAEYIVNCCRGKAYLCFMKFSFGDVSINPASLVELRKISHRSPIGCPVLQVRDGILHEYNFHIYGSTIFIDETE